METNREITIIRDTILCAAIHYLNGIEYPHQPKNVRTGLVICGRRHHNCIATFSVINENSNHFNRIKAVQGFLTSSDRFVSRMEALSIAREANQLIAEPSGNELYSENIY